MSVLFVSGYVSGSSIWNTVLCQSCLTIKWMLRRELIRTYSLAPWQPEKDLPRRPSAADVRCMNANVWMPMFEHSIHVQILEFKHRRRCLYFKRYCLPMHECLCLHAACSYIGAFKRLKKWLPKICCQCLNIQIFEMEHSFKHRHCRRIGTIMSSQNPVRIESVLLGIL